MGDRMEFNSKITVRKIGRIIENVQEGLLALITNDTGLEREDVKSALNSPEIKQQMQKYMRDGGVWLVGGNGSPVF